MEAARRAAESQAASQAAAAKAAADEAVGRHLAFIDRLLADKAELSRQCENLAAQLKAQEERHAAAEEKREEAYSREMKRQKEMWAAGEKTRREQVSMQAGSQGAVAPRMLLAAIMASTEMLQPCGPVPSVAQVERLALSTSLSPTTP